MKKRRRKTARRRVQNLLNIKQPPRATAPTFGGRPLSALLSNRNGAGKTDVTIDELLTLKTKSSRARSRTSPHSKCPVNYSAATNIGSPGIARGRRSGRSLEKATAANWRVAGPQPTATACSSGTPAPMRRVSTPCRRSFPTLTEKSGAGKGLKSKVLRQPTTRATSASSSRSGAAFPRLARCSTPDCPSPTAFMTWN